MFYPCPLRDRIITAVGRDEGIVVSGRVIGSQIQDDDRIDDRRIFLQDAVETSPGAGRLRSAVLSFGEIVEVYCESHFSPPF